VFATNAGEWPFNLEFGVPYNEGLLGRYFDETAAAAILAAAAEQAPAVAPVPIGNVTFSLDDETRTLRPTIAPVYTIGGESFDFTAQGNDDI